VENFLDSPTKKSSLPQANHQPPIVSGILSVIPVIDNAEFSILGQKFIQLRGKQGTIILAILPDYLHSF